MIIEREWSLSEAARMLGEPQHRLIYLCEKGVVIPDFGEAKGRGSSRRFSARNILEFAVALKLRELMMPVTAIAAINHVMRELEKLVSREIPGFSLPRSLQKSNAPELRIIIGDGPKLHFSLGLMDGPPRIFGGLDLTGLISREKGGRGSGLKKLSSSHALTVDETAAASKPETAPYKARLEVNVTAMARDLSLKV